MVIGAMLFLILKFYVIDVVPANDSSMASTLSKGDLLLVNRIWQQLHTNDLVYVSLDERLDTVLKENVYAVQRVIGLPGDSIEIVDKRVFINDFPISDTSTVIYNYFLRLNNRNDSIGIEKALAKYDHSSIDAEGDVVLQVPLKDTFSVCKMDQLKNCRLKLEQKGSEDETVFPYSGLFAWNLDQFGKLYLPAVGDTLQLDHATVVMYARMIRQNEGVTLEMKGDTAMVDGEPADQYIVQKNYYFVLADNRDNSRDSRTFGPIPEEKIKGKVIRIIKRTAHD